MNNNNNNNDILFLLIALLNTSIGLSNNDKNTNSIEKQKLMYEKLEVINKKLDRLLEVMDIE